MQLDIEQPDEVHLGFWLGEQCHTKSHRFSRIAVSRMATSSQSASIV
jgi:hypothetical protein